MAAWRSCLGAILILLAAAAPSRASPAGLGTASREVADDAAYLIDNIPLDLADIATSPLHVAQPGSPFRSGRFYLELAGAAALFGGSFALDQTMRMHLGGMPRSTHDVMENFSYVTLVSSLGLLYAYGLYDQDSRLRHYLLTGTEAAGMGVLFNLAIKAAFGRWRPSQTGSHLAFFHAPRSFNSRSFTSNDMVIETSMATGVSEYYDNEWYVAVPIYSLALLEGFTRMGDNQQWFSDVVAGGLLGWATAEAMIWLHKRHAAELGRWRIVPLPPPPVPARGNASLTPSVGLSIACSW